MGNENFVVAFLDILGFKYMIASASFDEILNVFKRIISEEEARNILRHTVQTENKRFVQYNKVLEEARIHIMSDSIVVATPDKYEESLAVVVDICNHIQNSLYKLEKPVLLRGAIAVGKMYIGDNLVFGQAMVDAYITQENYAVYPRIIVSEEICKNRVASVDNFKLIKDEEDEYYYIDTLQRYLEVYDRSYDEYINSSKYAHIKQYIDSQLMCYQDKHVRKKYIWLRSALKNAVNYEIKQEEAFIDNLGWERKNK